MGVVKRGGETRRRGRRDCGRDIKKCKTKQKSFGLWKTGRTLEIRLYATGRDARGRFTIKPIPQDPRPLGPNNLLPVPRHQPQLSPPKHLMWPGSHLPMSRRLRNPHPYFLLLTGPLLINYSQPAISQLRPAAHTT